MMRYRLTVIADDVSAGRVQDSAFWMLLYELLTWPSERHQPDLLYNQLLSFLSFKPYSALLADNSAASAADWNTIPLSGDVTQVKAIVEACTVVMVRKGVAVGVARLFSILLRFQLCLMVFADMHQGNMKGIIALSFSKINKKPPTKWQL